MESNEGFASYGQSSSNWTKKSCECLQADYTSNPRAKNHGVTISSANSRYCLELDTVDKVITNKFFNELLHFRLQEFKLKTANTVITAENSSLTTMSTEKVNN